jgi:hypothetical protein
MRVSAPASPRNRAKTQAHHGLCNRSRPSCRPGRGRDVGQTSCAVRVDPGVGDPVEEGCKRVRRCGWQLLARSRSPRFSLFSGSVVASAHEARVELRHEMLARLCLRFHRRPPRRLSTSEGPPQRPPQVRAGRQQQALEPPLPASLTLARLELGSPGPGADARRLPSHLHPLGPQLPRRR